MRPIEPKAGRPLAPALAVAGALALGGCATPTVPALDRAELSLREAAADPLVVEHAPVALHDAEQAVDRARAALDDEEESEVEHLAYLAQRRVEIARAEAQRQAALADAQQLGDEQRESAHAARAAALRAELERLRARETDRGLVVSVDDVLFAVDRAELQPGARADLARLAAFLRENPERPVRVEGHTDSTGTAAYNVSLSEARAEAVASALIAQGVPPARIETHGFGQSMPVASNATAAGRQQNRRVEIVIANPPAVGSAAPR